MHPALWFAFGFVCGGLICSLLALRWAAGVVAAKMVERIKREFPAETPPWMQAHFAEMLIRRAEHEERRNDPQ